MSEDIQALPRLKRAAKRLCDAQDAFEAASDAYRAHPWVEQIAADVTEAAVDLMTARDAIRALI